MNFSSIVDRISSRILNAFQEKREYISTYEHGWNRIDDAINRNEFEEVWIEYEKFCESLQPLIKEISQIDKFSRPDEKRKLKNLWDALHQLKVFTNYTDAKNLYFQYLKKEEPIEDQKRWALTFMKGRRERLDSSFMYIMRIYDRVVSYLDIEKQFKYEEMTIINQYGYRKEEYQSVLDNLSKASSILRSKGVGKCIDGAVIVLQVRSGGSKASYSEHDDTIKMDIEKPHHLSDMYIYIHEFGHRYYNNFLSSLEKEEYNEEFYKSTNSLTVVDREMMWDVLERNKFLPMKASREMPTPELAEELILRWNEIVTKSGWRSKDVLQMEHLRQNIKVQFVHSKKKYIVPLRKNMHSVSVTTYGDTNPHEDFAETFTFYVLSMNADKEKIDRFKKFLKL